MNESYVLVTELVRNLELLKFCVVVGGCVFFGVMLTNYGQSSTLAWIWGEFGH